MECTTPPMSRFFLHNFILHIIKLLKSGSHLPKKLVLFASMKVLFKDTHRYTPSNKTQAVTKIMDMDIWVMGTLNQLFIRSSYTQIKVSKK